jgi:hypothetical protein
MEKGDVEGWGRRLEVEIGIDGALDEGKVAGGGPV